MSIELNAATEATVAPIRESLRAAEKIRALRYPDAEASPPSSVLPDLATRQGKVLGFNVTTGAPEAVELPTAFSEILIGGDATGDIYYRSGTGDTARLPIGTTGHVLTVSGGLPAWAAAPVSWSASAAETLTNKTLGSGTVITAATMTLGSDATGDIYYRAAGGALTRLAAGTDGHVLTLASGLPSWAAPAAGGGGLTNWTDALSTASPNNVKPAASLTATNAATNVDAVIAPKGTGALIAQVPDSTTTGGNKRGTRAVDWQTSRSAATQAATGSYAVISGGQNNTASNTNSTVSGGLTNAATSDYTTVSGGATNTASGTHGTVSGGLSNTASGAYSMVAGGRNNTASGDYSTAGGYNATTRGIRGAEAYSAGRTGTIDGDAQRAAYMLSAATTDATPTELVAGNVTPAAAVRIVLPNNSTYSFTGQVAARTSTGETATWRISGTIKRGANAAATELVGTPSKTDTNATAGASAWDITIDANTTDGALRIQGTGAAATNIRWVARIDTVEAVF